LSAVSPLASYCDLLTQPGLIKHTSLALWHPA
jgi:hypothetical protein